MVSSKQVPLSEAYWFQEGPGVRNWQFTTSGVKLLNVGNITKDGSIDLDKTDKHISLDEAEGKYSHFLVDEGDLVIASSGISFDEDGMLRTRGAFIEKKHLPLCLNTSTIRFKAIDGVSDLNFFKFWLDSFEFRDQVSRLVTGSAQQNFGPSHLKAINISLPPLTEQKRIASLLARADRLRSLRRTGRALGESLLQSVFLEMFGEPRTNPKNWKVEKVDKHIKSIRYGTGSPPDYQEKGISFIRATNVKQGTIKAEGLVYISEEDAEKISKCKVNAGDLIIVRSGVNSGDCALIPPEYDGAYAAYDLIVEVPFPTNHFLNTAINSQFGKEIIATLSRRAGQPHVNSEQIESIELPFPPLALQEEFAGVVARVEGLRGRMSEAERQGEGLFESLLAEAFA
ncbi:MAG: hypothetical protein HFACDABA_01317 [Anaerolineales bacterium]|nr:hypothetical protein [Anaerolineales bacterium]